MRTDGRADNALRSVRIERGYTKHAAGSVLISMGDTRVLCTAMFEDRLPAWLRGGGRGWVTAEYAMLPGATETRSPRDSSSGGRAREISRLIGRSLRAVTNLRAMGECQVTVDCDVLQADGGTRTAAITGAWVALADAFSLSVKSGHLPESPLTGACAAVSAGLVDGRPLLDLCYAEDARASADFNFVMDDRNRLIEVQGAAEGEPFDRAALNRLLDLGESGIRELLALQREALSNG
ncbi:MAG: ribonuclease PH [Candidatus Hydrogenedens sp.]|nr:ribonuclease PH [Candidatus Hydrogenedentota bacterium]NLF58066.1 ribonuclease PH [Candidatus Hydrogenedens sp.]